MPRRPKDPDALTREEQESQQQDPQLQSYTTGGGSDKAADPEQNVILENEDDVPRTKDC